MYVERVIAEFPQIQSYVDVNEGPYEVLGEFALFLRDGIKQRTIDLGDQQKAFELLNTMGTDNDLEVQNLLVVGVLEILADYEETIDVSKRFLSGHALELFHRVLIGWNHS